MGHDALHLSAKSAGYLSEPRRGTRIDCQIPLTLKNLDLADPFSEPCSTMLVNPQGCAARVGRPLAIGTAVELVGLPGGAKVTARVVNCIEVKNYGNSWWLLGLSLDKAGNVWGVKSPPEDWCATTEQS